MANENYHPSRAVLTTSMRYNDRPPGGPDMERVARLEAQMEAVDKRLDRMDGKLDTLIERTGSLPTTNGLWGMIATVIGVGLAIAGLTFVIAEWVKT